MSGREVWKRGVDVGAAKSSQLVGEVEVKSSVQDAVMSYILLNASSRVLEEASSLSSSSSASFPGERVAVLRAPTLGVGAKHRSKQRANNTQTQTKAERMLVRHQHQEDGHDDKSKQRGKKRGRRQDSSSDEEEEHDVGKSAAVK